MGVGWGEQLAIMVLVMCVVWRVWCTEVLSFTDLHCMELENQSAVVGGGYIELQIQLYLIYMCKIKN